MILRIFFAAFFFFLLALSLSSNPTSFSIFFCVIRTAGMETKPTLLSPLSSQKREGGVSEWGRGFPIPRRKERKAWPSTEKKKKEKRKEPKLSLSLSARARRVASTVPLSSRTHRASPILRVGGGERKAWGENANKENDDESKNGRAKSEDIVFFLQLRENSLLVLLTSPPPQNLSR